MPMAEILNSLQFLGDRAMFCSKEVTLGGFLNSFRTDAAASGEEMD